MTIVPVILAGGVGERFWPLSRSARPKQLLPITTNRSMLEETLRRMTPLCGKGARPLIVTGCDMAPKIRAAIPKSLAYDVIAEPVGRDTAPAIAIAAAWICRTYGDAVMAIDTADHAIGQLPLYRDAMKVAVQTAVSRDCLVTFGIRPTRPDTGYGYVQTGTRIGTAKGAPCFEVQRFVEKPDLATARRYVKSSTYLWNSGMFVWKASVVLDEFQQHMPELCAQALEASESKFSRKAIERFYSTCEKKSIDYGILEHSTKVLVVAPSFSWDDVGSWEALPRLKGTSAHKVTVDGSSVYEAECANTIVVNKSGSTVACVGLDNIVVVATGDAVLAISRDKLPQLKKYLTAMKADARFDRALF